MENWQHFRSRNDEMIETNGKIDLMWNSHVEIEAQVDMADDRMIEFERNGTHVMDI